MGNIEKYEFYKLCVEEAGKVSERRMKNNQYFTLLHSALISFIATLYVKETSIKTILAVIFLSALGAILCNLWKKSILSYKGLNSAKFKIICDMENDFDCKCFTDEWNILKESKEYKILSSHETQAARLFFAAYISSIAFHLVMLLIA